MPEIANVAKYSRKPFLVDAVQVTVDNIDDIVDWCKGEAKVEGDAAYIKVPVARVLNERQTKAFIGDWVLYAGTGFKVYTDKAFQKGFEPVDGVVKDAVLQASKG